LAVGHGEHELNVLEAHEKMKIGKPKGEIGGGGGTEGTKGRFQVVSGPSRQKKKKKKQKKKNQNKKKKK